MSKKEKGVFDDYSSWQKFRQSPEWRGAKWIAKACLVVTIYFYLVGAFGRTYTWAEIKWMRSTPFSQIDAIIEDAKKDNDFSYAYKWVRARPFDDTAGVMAAVERHAEILPSIFFFEQARRVRDTASPDDHAFWALYARYRLQYDLIRCGDPDMIDGMQIMLRGSLADDKAVMAVLEDQKRLKKTLERIVAYDAEKPARNNPMTVCKMVGHSRKYEVPPVEAWTMIRHNLIAATTAGINKMESAP